MDSSTESGCPSEMLVRMVKSSFCIYCTTSTRPVKIRFFELQFLHQCIALFRIVLIVHAAHDVEPDVGDQEASSKNA